MVLAALAGALGAAGVLLARERLVLLAGLALLGVAGVSLAQDNPVTAIDIVLEPGGPMIERATAALGDG